MARFPVITIGAAGVDMRQNPLFLDTSRASSATNLTFDEATIKTRFDIDYHNLGLRGQFQGSTYYTPSTGLSAASYSNTASSLATVVNGKINLNIINGTISTKPVTLGGGEKFKGDTFLFDGENYLVVLNPNTASYWSDAGGVLVRSPGLVESGGESHDEIESVNNKNWIPNGASIGHYINARTHISIDCSRGPNCPALNSEMWVSDIGGKRSIDDCTADDILKMEEAMLDSGGGPLVGPSKLGKTVALETLLSSGNNGEGFFVDFKESGIMFHDTFEYPRETLFSADAAAIIQEGWDEKRLSNVQLQTISAVGRYAVYQLPDDIWFRSEYGFHFIKKVLGTGTLKDEKRNHESHDIQPLLDLDEDNLEGVSVGYWLRNDRLMGTVGMIKDTFFSSSTMGRGIAVLNQATTYTEDDTPRPLWEGLTLPDDSIKGIHKFTKFGERAKDKEFGFICSDLNRNLFLGEFVNRRTGYDNRDGKSHQIPWQYTSGAFVMTGIKNVDALRNGYMDFIGDESTSNVTIEVRTDQHECWETWTEVETGFSQKSLKSTSFGEPSNKSVREATWFQFRIKGLGYIEIRTFDVEAVKVDSKKDGRNQCTPVCCEQEDYFKL